MKQWLFDRKRRVYVNGNRTIEKRGWPAGHIRYDDGSRFVDIDYEVDMRGISIWPERLVHWTTRDGSAETVTKQERQAVVSDLMQYGRDYGMSIDPGGTDPSSSKG